MKNLALLCFLITFALTTFGQTPKPTPKKTPKPVKTVAVKLGSETEEFEKAKAVSNPAERIEALQNFIKNFPESAELARAQGAIVTSRVELGIMKLQAGDMAGGIELYKTAVADAPVPVPDEVFSKVLIGLPVSLYALNQRGGAFDVAKVIEEKIGANAGQILDLSKFYLNIEYGTEAIRLAQKAVELAPDAANAYQVLATAYRLNFRLEDAANAYAKAAELEGEAVINKLSLAEMKRALGKTEEAVALYREILAKDAANKTAQAGLTLTLFDAGKRADAETELKKSLEADPENARLLTSAAYWYASRGFNDEAIEYAKKAIAIEPRNVWSYIAQSRALVAQNKPLEAEKVLLAARAYSDFPTLDYEIASVRLAAGLYREAAETLKRSFVVNQEGLIETYLGNRILADAKSFTELLSLERRTAIFETNPADSEENTNKLKALLAFHQKLEAKDATEDELAAAAEEFAKGGDNMRLHRQLFAASRLLQKKTALPKVLELTQAAIGGVDSALNVPSPSAAVLADEIYESRQYAISQNLVVVVPEIPRQTLSAILRGQIEDIAGRALFQQSNVAQSIVRLKRALSVLPDKSAWARASLWHLGEALQADGKEKEALEAFIKGYNKEIPNLEKRAFIENLYVKVNGSTNGLDELVGAKPETTVATTETKPTPTNTDNVKTTEPIPSPEVKPETSPTPKAEETPQTITEVKPEPSPTPKTEETPETKTETKTEPDVLPENIPAVTPEKTPGETPSPTTETTPAATPSPTPEETPKTEEVKPAETKTEEVKTEPSPSPTPEETPTTEVQPTPITTLTPELKTEEKKAEETKPEPTPEPKTEEIKTEENKPTETNPEPAPNPSPTPPTVAVVITDNIPQVPPSPKVDESKTENKTQPGTSQNTPKPLFEPVIISVGKTEPTKTEKEKPNPTDEKPTATVQKNEPAPTKETNPETEIPNPENKPTEKKPDEKILSGENRPRIIITENTGAKTVTEEISSCKLITNPESLSLLNGGGSLGVMVGLENGGDFKQITAASSSPNDIEVKLEPGIGESSNLAFFIVKSTSSKTGVFSVTFEAPCGKKEILVKVR
jgi:tetratricopeptide (TPR) repeat protein